ncbi:MAG: hypothetical protein CME70_24460 [Halobacteriovorax sp.]|nr:hypothetical protein [Halobacteriovorax sp.]|tara:strand:- start:715 stop:1491 length:777 start_codon:yes stop_codon:yes gene_type:complete
MLPLFKSHYSIGKSILTLDSPGESNACGSDSILDIAKEHSLSEVILVEDSLTGFMQAMNICESIGINLIFGLRLSCYNSEVSLGDSQTSHKIIIFPKNKEGCSLLNKIYTHAFCEDGGEIKEKSLLALFNPDLLKLAVPFYDSFIFNNLTMLGSACAPLSNFTDIEPTFFIEENQLPFDGMVKEAVLSYCEKSGFEYEPVKSIYYKKRTDFEAYQTHKCICGRSFSASRSLSTPKQDHLGSEEFCFESYLDYESSHSN